MDLYQFVLHFNRSAKREQVEHDLLSFAFSRFTLHFSLNSKVWVAFGWRLDRCSIRILPTPQKRALPCGARRGIEITVIDKCRFYDIMEKERVSHHGHTKAKKQHLHIPAETVLSKKSKRAFTSKFPQNTCPKRQNGECYAKIRYRGLHLAFLHR